MHANDLKCWKCGEAIALQPPLGRRETCKKCGSELHVCKMCVEFDRAYAHWCREPTADEVHDKEHANFCDHFKPRLNAFVAPELGAVIAAKAALDKLFKN